MFELGRPSTQTKCKGSWRMGSRVSNKEGKRVVLGDCHRH